MASEMGRDIMPLRLGGGFDFENAYKAHHIAVKAGLIR